ncbi:F-box domain-containing protein [Colletotrichum orchidophilum]|uniref:F-box domain-containing protein n=1 Tax=Colletotrichum orchidophilum TaxID=1209926 RepID=A0A1G4B029_9PEZI|nr:F-box domain-containing protein [Colletotrichum orchidophilum]OHE94744.1 F-box domain-containing protein [Colletotrichum orchidophilum]
MRHTLPTMDSAQSCDKATASASEPATKRLSFLDLPPETQKDIFSHCSQSDLICLSLVSRHFRELAAAQLYRNFHIVFPDEDDPSFDSPIDSLAGGLETFVSSEYDYAQHLRDISLDTLSAGDKAEAAYKPYLYSASCGKFMNTLLSLTLKNAKSLETFRWNIRVELSRPVYKALHQIATLKNLHVRMQAGPSLFEIPPPLPYSTNLPPPTSTQGHWDPLPVFSAVSAPPPPFASMSLNVPPPYNPSSLGSHPPLPPALKPTPRNRRRVAANDPATLGGFRKLNSLVVLDIDTLDTIAEIKSCVRNSASTLTKLKLSFSAYLALQSRKPPPDTDPDDSDQDDEFEVVPLPSAPGWDEASGPAKAFRAQEERKSQESVLGRIFDVEPFLVKKAQHRKSLKGKAKIDTPTHTQEAGSPAEAFMSRLREVSSKLMASVADGDADDGSKQEILEMIEKASRRYLEAEEAKTAAEAATKAKDKTTEAESGTSAGEGSSTAAATSTVNTGTQPATTVEVCGASAAGGDISSKSKATTGADSNPEDINVEEPMAADEAEEQSDGKIEQNQEQPTAAPETTSAIASRQEPISESHTTVRAKAALEAQKANFETLVLRLQHLLSEATSLQEKLEDLRTTTTAFDRDHIRYAENQLQGFYRDIENVRTELNATEAEIRDVEKQVHGIATTAHSEDEKISEYIRSTRGVALRSFSVHLIPVKASVFKAAIDVRVLKRLTLLNVGSQAPIWTMLAKENKAQPLPLRKIFTDNVSISFLTFASQLEQITELFMLERSAKYKPESFAPKTNVIMDQIRRLVLKKHMPTLTRLMIKNDATMAWDVDEKAMLLICNRGKQLEELAAALGIRAMHTFMQHLGGLANLRALNVISFRNDDTCVWVMRETRKFLVDNLSHHPNMKLEWISIDDDRVERIIRPPPQTPAAKAEEKRNKKGKKPAGSSFGAFGGPGTSTGSGAPGVFPPLPMPGWETDSDSDDEDTDIVANTKLETVEGVHFYDVWDVRIFKKEVMAGRL